MPAAVSAAPSMVLTEATSLVGYDRVHSTAAGAVPEFVRDRSSVTDPPLVAVPVDSVKVPCA